MALLAITITSQARADVCAWRDPERTMQRLFPAAHDYKTITKKMTPERIQAVETLLGAKLDPSEKIEFNYYEITGPGAQRVGTIVALAGKGEYGVIEVVTGVDTNGRVIGAYIQRSRERATKLLEQERFLSQFKGRAMNDRFSDIAPPAPQAAAAARVVTETVRKMLAIYDVLRRTA